ncbi:hypothetical protein V6N11_013504 [Hibiscus sabdariffa]|uniref:Uncharacterized protein n=1 Tax=Hibiscus sabdariffa TaxID=183260 RepID=A0ABR1ZGN4_9ROSI
MKRKARLSERQGGVGRRSCTGASCMLSNNSAVHTKYRLHTRRPSPSVQHNANSQAPQFVVVGGIWMPPPEYATMTATTTSTKPVTVTPSSGIYTPVATPLPTLAQPSATEERGSHSEGRVHSNSNSQSTSSSTHTTTDSPAYN